MHIKVKKAMKKQSENFNRDKKYFKSIKEKSQN